VTTRLVANPGGQSVTYDTSVLVAALVSWHEKHHLAREVIGRSAPVVPAHVLMETYSVLTRLPPPHRLAPETVLDALRIVSADLLTLSPDRYLGILTGMASRGLKGGAVYDALVGATALEHDRTLLSLDRRALPTYEAVGVAVQLL
jgi:predicted nucleic acid-binding protein